MAIKQGFLKKSSKKNHDTKESPKIRKVKLSTVKNGKTDSGHNAFFDTPKNDRVKKAGREKTLTKMNAKQGANQKDVGGKTGIDRGQGGFLAALKTRLASVFKRNKSAKTRKDDALAFASSNRRDGKRGRKIKRIVLYAAGGLVVAALVLAVVLLPQGEAALTQSEPAVTQPEISDKAIAAAPSARPETSVNIAFEGSAPIPTTVSDNAGNAAAAPIETTPPDTTTMPIYIADLVEDFRVKADLYYNEVGYSSNHYNYTENDVYMLAQVIDCEARGESFTGMVAVGNVVMNRVLLRGYFGSTIASVITAKDQFHYISSRSPSSACKRAARAVLEDENWVVPQHVYYFHSARPEGEDWGSHKFYTKIGGHCFYTHRYYGRARIEDAPPALFERTYQWPQLGCKPQDRVYRIQYMLNSFGYDVYADKYFGQDTKDAIKAFQEKKGLDADGVAGPSTIEAMINAYGLAEYYQKFCM